MSKEERAINDDDDNDDDDDDDDDDPPIDEDDVTKLSEQVGSADNFIMVVIAYFFCKGCVKNVVKYRVTILLYQFKAVIFTYN